jgi:hypothetical protein
LQFVSALRSRQSMTVPYQQSAARTMIDLMFSNRVYSPFKPRPAKDRTTLPIRINNRKSRP